VPFSFFLSFFLSLSLFSIRQQWKAEKTPDNEMSRDYIIATCPQIVASHAFGDGEKLALSGVVWKERVRL
jgi:hypothetical protein